MPPVIVHVDARGQPCPLPILALARACRGVEAGTRVEVLASDPAFPADVRAWCEARGATLQALDIEGAGWRATVLAPGPAAGHLAQQGS